MLVSLKMRGKPFSMQTPWTLLPFSIHAPCPVDPCMKSVLEECRLIANEKVLKEEVALREFVDRALKSLKSAKDSHCVRMPESWGDQVFAYSGKIELQLERLRSADPSSEASSRKKSLLGDAVAALEFLVSERSQVFDAVDYHLEWYSFGEFCRGST